jgi:hypothetical protein
MTETQSNALFALYNERLKAFMDLNNVIQYNLENDEALNFMRSE